MLLQGILRPINAASMAYYTQYLVFVEEYRYTGYPEVTMTLYPEFVCNSSSCPQPYMPDTSQLEVRSRYTDSCSGVYEAYDMGGVVDDVRSVVLKDNYSSSCGGDEITADIEHRDGTREYLTGYRTY